jgi:hypothetical protein
VLFEKFTFFEHFYAEFAFCLHYQLEHLVVGTSFKEKFTCENFKKTASDGPSVQPMSLFGWHFAAKNDLRSSIVACNQILNFGRMFLKGEGSSKIGQFDGFEIYREQEVIGLDIGVNDFVLPEFVQAQKHRNCVLPNVL